MIQQRRIRLAGNCIGHMDRRQRRETRLGALLWMMVVRYGMNQRERKPPDAHQVGSHLCMCAAEKLTLEIDPIFLRSAANLQIILRQLRQQDDLPKIMKQSSSETFLDHRLRAVLADGNALSQRRNCNAVIPQCRQIRVHPRMTIELRKYMYR